MVSPPPPLLDDPEPNTAPSEAATEPEAAEPEATEPEATGADAAAGRALDWLNRQGGWLAAILLVGLIAGLVGHSIGEPSHPAADSVDVGFLQDMYHHHDQAVEMSLIMAADASNKIVRGEAQEIVIQQRFEQGAMAAWLGEWGHDLGDLDRTAMTWMKTPTPIDQMDGMQSPQQMAALRAATGTEEDILFLQMMNDHHRGGIHMADYAAARAADPRVRNQAKIMARNQSMEIAEMNGMISRLQRLN